jgi:thiol-disulfide isomerase/thioredoxin
MEKLLLGKTELPIDVIEEYIQSLGSIYTPEVCTLTHPRIRHKLKHRQSYDLFLHNCNNFTQDLAIFLVGKSIPEHIKNLPQTFLSTPFGQMMKPQIEQALRGVTQAAAPAPQPLPRAPVTAAAPARPGAVRQVSNLSQLEDQLKSAVNSCAVIFFTSATCPPCKVVYPTYDELAEEAGDKAVLIKVDISAAYDVSMKYGVRATPTFMTFLKGNKLDEWSGADPAKLRGNVRLLIEMAHPTHRHRQLHLPSFQRHLSNFVMYKKIPPLDKLVQKLQPHHEDPRLKSMIAFITARSSSTTPTSPAADVALPDALPTFASYLQSTFHALPPENHFALVDLARLLFLDTRVSSFFAEEPNHTTLLTLLSPSTSSSCPYNLRIVTLQLICNLFSSPLYLDHLTTNTANSGSSSSSNLHATVLTLTISSLLDPHPNLRTVAASLAYNLSAANHNARFAGLPDKLTEEEQVELTASLVEAIAQEKESAEALHGLLFALGLLVYEAPADGAVVDLCRALGITETVRAKAEMGVFAKEGVIREVGGELLAKGL